jgi:hypothetical protein
MQHRDSKVRTILIQAREPIGEHLLVYERNNCLRPKIPWHALFHVGIVEVGHS